MAKPGFKFVANHCVRLFEQVPISIYTNIPALIVKLVPEDGGADTIKGISGDSSDILNKLHNWVEAYLEGIETGKKDFRLEINFIQHEILSPFFNPVLLYVAVCTQVNEWLHHPKEKNELVAWLIKKNNFEDSDLITACVYGGIMGAVGIRPFRVYQPKGLFFQLEPYKNHSVSTIQAEKIPLFILALERSDYETLFELIQETGAAGNLQESYLGALHLKQIDSIMHVSNVSNPDTSTIQKQTKTVRYFEIDSNGCSVL